jgi:hypothetical protein
MTLVHPIEYVRSTESIEAVKLNHIFGVREYVNVRTRNVTLKQ